MCFAGSGLNRDAYFRQKKNNNMETSVYEAKCNNCKFYMVLMSEHVIQYKSEDHMMETGHTVEITKVS